MCVNKYFNLAQWTNDPDDSFLGRMSYQYGVGTHSQAFLDLPAAAAFSAVAPFDFLQISDGCGAAYTFTFRPDIAPGAPTVVGRNVAINIQGQTNAQVAQSFVDAVAAVSAFLFTGGTGRLLTTAHKHTTPANRVTLTQLQIGVTGILDVSGITAVAGFAGAGFLQSTGAGAVAAGRTYATGGILTVDGSLLVDTETLVITAPDLSNPAGQITVTFEFDSGAGVTPGNTAIPFTALDTQPTVAASIAAAINNPAAPPAGRGANFALRATVVPFGPISFVYLQATILGSLGGGLEQPELIVETVANAGFVAFGMTGGQDGSIVAPLLWGPKRGMIPQAAGGFEIARGEG
jgi:hypothetical protein